MPSSKFNLRERLEDTELDLSMSEIEEVPVKEIAAIKKATSLDLSNNQLKSLGKNFAPMLTRLMKLDLSKNHLTDLPENFGELVNLRHLDLYSNQITHLPLSFGQLKMLRWLDLKNNPLMPKLAEIAGPCLDTKQCQECARKVVTFLQTMQVQVEEERQRRLLQKRKQQEMAEQAQKKDQQQQQSQKSKKKKAVKSNINMTQTASENGVGSISEESSVNSGSTKKTSAKQPVDTCTHKKRSGVLPVLFRMFKMMMIGAFLMSLALWFLYLFDEQRFRETQVHAVMLWSRFVGALPVQVTETGQRINELLKPVMAVAWNKTEETYVWVSTSPTVQDALQVCGALWRILYVKTYELCRTVNQEIPVYVETVKKKIF